MTRTEQARWEIRRIYANGVTELRDDEIAETCAMSPRSVANLRQQMGFTALKEDRRAEVTRKVRENWDRKLHHRQEAEDIGWPRTLSSLELEILKLVAVGANNREMVANYQLCNLRYLAAILSRLIKAGYLVRYGEGRSHYTLSLHPTLQAQWDKYAAPALVQDEISIQSSENLSSFAVTT